jgi:hypothetical protein
MDYSWKPKNKGWFEWIILKIKVYNKIYLRDNKAKEWDIIKITSAPIYYSILLNIKIGSMHSTIDILIYFSIWLKW